MEVLRVAQATLTITDYSLRNLAFLMLADPLSFAQTDEIKGGLCLRQSIYGGIQHSQPLSFISSRVTGKRNRRDYIR